MNADSYYDDDNERKHRTRETPQSLKLCNAYAYPTRAEDDVSNEEFNADRTKLPDNSLFLRGHIESFL